MIFVVSVSQLSDIGVLNHIKKRYRSGRVSEKSGHWTVNSGAAITFLKRIRPYTRVKSQQIDYFFECWALRESCPRKQRPKTVEDRMKELVVLIALEKKKCV